MISTTNEVSWPSGVSDGVAPKWFAECFRQALRRLAIVLNANERFSLCKRSWGTRPDGWIARRFTDSDLEQALIRFHIEGDDPIQDDEYRAENFFYGRFDFSETSRPLTRGDSDVPRKPVGFRTTQTFLNWSYQRLHAPQASDVELQRHTFGSDGEFIKHCATNYLVKNFWHNFVHREIQAITEANYSDFSGDARSDSDFEADNLANIYLVCSYGLPIRRLGRISPETAANIEALLARNRCNLVFAERARHRHHDRQSMTEGEKWEELEWRFRRGLANHISTKLLAMGLAVRTLGVFLTGEVKKRGERIYRDGEVVVELNGIRIASQCPAYIPDDELRAEREAKAIPPVRQTAIRRKRDNRWNEITTNILITYRKQLSKRIGMKEYSDGMMRLLLERFGM